MEALLSCSEYPRRCGITVEYSCDWKVTSVMCSARTQWNKTITFWEPEHFHRFALYVRHLKMTPELNTWCLWFIPMFQKPVCLVQLNEQIRQRIILWLQSYMLDSLMFSLNMCLGHQMTASYHLADGFLSLNYAFAEPLTAFTGHLIFLIVWTITYQQLTHVSFVEMLWGL